MVTVCIFFYIWCCWLEVNWHLACKHSHSTTLDGYCATLLDCMLANMETKQKPLMLVLHWCWLINVDNEYANMVICVKCRWCFSLGCLCVICRQRNTPTSLYREVPTTQVTSPIVSSFYFDNNPVKWNSSMSLCYLMPVHLVMSASCHRLLTAENKVLCHVSVQTSHHILVENVLLVASWVMTGCLLQSLISSNLNDIGFWVYLLTYTPCLKKTHHPVVTISLSNPDRFAIFFRFWKVC